MYRGSDYCLGASGTFLSLSLRFPHLKNGDQNIHPHWVSAQIEYNVWVAFGTCWIARKAAVVVAALGGGCGDACVDRYFQLLSLAECERPADGISCISICHTWREHW